MQIPVSTDAGGFFSEEHRQEYEARFPLNASAGPSGNPTTGHSAGPAGYKRDKGKAKASPKVSSVPDEFGDESGRWTPQTDSDVPVRRRPPTPSSSPEPPRMQAPPVVSFSAPLRTSLDMPIRGSKDAPRTFKGKHTEVQPFLDHFELLLNKCRVTDDKEKCACLLKYCSIEVQNVIQTMECFHQHKWSRLRKELLKHYDAERALQKYKPADVYAYALKMRHRACYSLTQWRKYYVKYNSIAGGPLNRHHMGREDYLAYFWMGIHKPLRQILENRILQSNPYRDDEAQYTMKELDTAADWYFRRNKYESLMVKAVEFGEERDEEYSGEDSDKESTSSEDSASDYEEFRRKKKQRARRKKQEKKGKTTGKGDASEGKDRQKYAGNEDEIASMIRKLNAMKLDDPEYAPIYYKVMVLDKSGTAKDCVKPPFFERTERTPRTRPPANTQSAGPSERPTTPATYPNSIPISKTAPSGAGREFTGCFGCLGEGHRISDCQQIADLVKRNVITYNDETRRLTMKNGNQIWRRSGESLAVAAERIAGGNAPRVMLGVVDEALATQQAVQTFYSEASRRVRIVEEYTDESAPEDRYGESGDSDSEDNFRPAEVYLSAPRRVKKSSGVFPVERSVPSTRTARKEVFDGVYPPSRDKTRGRGGRELEGPNIEGPKTRSKDLRSKGESAQPLPEKKSSPAEAGKSAVKPRTPPPDKIGKLLPELTPVDARRVRFEVPEDVEMREDAGHDQEGGKGGNRKEKKKEEAASIPSKGEDTPLKTAGRQSELSATVDRQGVMERILDTMVPMSMREIMVTSKDLRTDFQDLIRVKNVRAVLLGNSQDHPLIANMDWPRTEGILIKVEMETLGKPICAIIDTGSQLDVVRADVAALQIRKTVDMSQVTNMNDANGGRGQLQGWIQDVEFTCGGATTVTDLWVSQQAPFELLLGRPWQRGNLVSIDEREEGTYLVFKDRFTRRPRYELLAVPYDAPAPDLRTGTPSHYQSFVVTIGDSLGNSGQNSQNDTVLQESQTGYINRVFEDISEPYRGDLARLAPTFRLVEAGMRQIRAFTDGDATCLDWLSGCENMNKRLSQNKEVYKETAGAPTAPACPDLGVAFLNMADPALADRQSLPYSANLASSYETVQYLSRQHLETPPPAVVPVVDESPLQLLDGALTRQWTKFLNNTPIDVRPTFVAAPQSEYYGAVTLADGQIVHQSSAQNAFRVFNDVGSGAPFTLAGHEVTLHFSSPRNPHESWPMELVLPSDERLREVMGAMTPEGAPPLEDPAFPVHAVAQPPPMISNEERRLQMMRVISLFLPGNSATYHPLQTRNTLDPLETLLMRPLSPLSPLSTISEEDLSSLSTLGSDPLATPPLKQLNADITIRLEETLGQNERTDDFAELPVEHPHDQPRLRPAFFSDDGSDASSIAPIACVHCLGPCHDTAMDCPLWGLASALIPPEDSMNTNTETPGTYYYLDDLILDPALIPFLLLGQARSDEVQRVFDLMLGPTLEERVAAAAAAVARGKTANGEGVDTRTDTELRLVLDAALNPVLEGLLSIPVTSSEQLRTLANTALRVRETYDEYVHSLRQEREQAEWDIVREQTQAWVDMTNAMGSDTDSDHDSMPGLEPNSRSPSPTPLAGPLLPPGIVVAIDSGAQISLALNSPTRPYASDSLQEFTLIDEASTLR